MTTEDSVIISDPGRSPVVVERRKDTIVIHAPRATLFLSKDEASRLAWFITGKPYIERYPVRTPAKARFETIT